MTLVPSYDIVASTHVDADPDTVYALVSDVTRMGEWSPEATGGEWTHGEPATLGSRFHGHNQRDGDTWTTECEVVDATPGRRFAWGVVTYTPEDGTSEWAFDLVAESSGCRLTQRYTMRQFPERLGEFLAPLSEDKRNAIVERRRRMLQEDMQQTVDSIAAAFG